MYFLYFVLIQLILLYQLPCFRSQPTIGGSGYCLSFRDARTDILEWEPLHNFFECDILDSEVDCEMTWTWWQRTFAYGPLLPVSISYATPRRVFFASDGHVVFQKRSFTTSATSASSSKVEEGRWYHWAVSWRKLDGRLKMYWDGDLVLDEPTVDLEIMDNLTSPSYLALGRRFDIDAYSNGHRRGFGFRGELDELKFWRRQLGDSEILDDMRMPTNVNSEGLVAHWSFDELPEENGLVFPTVGSSSFVGHMGGIRQTFIQDSTTPITSPTFAPSTLPVPLGSFSVVVLDPNQSIKAHTFVLPTGENTTWLELDAVPACCAFYPLDTTSPPTLRVGDAIPKGPNGTFALRVSVLDSSLLTSHPPYPQLSYRAYDDQTSSVGVVKLQRNRPPSLDSPRRETLRLLEGQEVEIILAGYDPDGHHLTARILNIPKEGTLFTAVYDHVSRYRPGHAILQPGEVDFIGNLVIYRAPENLTEVGIRSAMAHFEYELIDPCGASSEVGSKVFDIEFRDNIPEARSLEVHTLEDTDVLISLPGFDAEGSDLMYMISELPPHGELLLFDNRTGISTPFATWEMGPTIEQWPEAAPVFNYSSGRFLEQNGYTLQFGSEQVEVLLFASGLLGPPTECVFGGNCVGSCTAYNSYATRQPDGKRTTSIPDVYPMTDGNGDGYRDEFIDLYYNTKVRVTELTIYETLNPGSVVRIDLLDPLGVWDTVWSGEAQRGVQVPNLFKPPLCQRVYLTQVVRLFFKPQAVSGVNCIDAVSLTGEVDLKPGFVLDPYTTTSSNRVIYRPNANFYGRDHFVYRVNDCLMGVCTDRQGYNAVPLSGACPLNATQNCSGIISVVVAPVNDPPTIGQSVIQQNHTFAMVTLQVEDVDQIEGMRFYLFELQGEGRLHTLYLNGTIGQELELPVVLDMPIRIQASPGLDDAVSDTTDSQLEPAASSPVQDSATNATLTTPTPSTTSPTPTTATPTSPTTPTSSSVSTAEITLAFVHNSDDDYSTMPRDFHILWAAQDNSVHISENVTTSNVVECAPGMHLGPKGYCLDCPVGTFTDTPNRFAACTPCPIGYFQGHSGRTDCLPCNDLPFSGNYYQDEAGAYECKQCPENTLRLDMLPGVSVTECTCVQGFWQPEGWVNGAACDICPFGGVCLGNDLGTELCPNLTSAGCKNSLPFPAPDHWGQAEDRSIFLPCKDQNCEGGAEFECGTGYSKRLCSECAKDYWSIGQKCDFKCMKTIWEKVLMVVSTGLVILVWIGMNQVVAQEIESVDILLQFLQLGDIISKFSLNWTTAVSQFQNAVSVVNFEVDFIALWKCYMDWSYSWTFGLMLFMPISLAVYQILVDLPFIVYYLYFVKRCPQHSCPEFTFFGVFTFTPLDAEEKIDKLFTSILSCLVVTYPNICMLTLRTFSCKVGPNSSLYLVAGPEIDCWQGVHLWQVAASAVFILVFVIGLPATFAFVLMRAMRHNRLVDDRFHNRYAFLFARFKARFAWWELALMCRFLVMSLVLVFCEDHPMLQAMIGLSLLIVALAAHLHTKPFLQERLNVLDFVSLLGNLVYIMCGVIMTAADSNQHPDAQWVLLIGIGLVLAYGLYSLFLDLHEYMFTALAVQWLTRKLSRQFFLDPTSSHGPLRDFLAIIEESFDNMRKSTDRCAVALTLEDPIPEMHACETFEEDAAVLEKANLSRTNDVDHVDAVLRIMKARSTFSLASITLDDRRRVAQTSEKRISSSEASSYKDSLHSYSSLGESVRSPTSSRKTRKSRKTPRRNSQVTRFRDTLKFLGEMVPVPPKLEWFSVKETFQEIRSILEPEKRRTIRARVLRNFKRRVESEYALTLDYIDAYLREKQVPKSKCKLQIVRELAYTMKPKPLKAWVLSAPSDAEIENFHALDMTLTPLLADSAEQSIYQLEDEKMFFRRFIDAFPCVIDWLLLKATHDEAVQLGILLDSLVSFCVSNKLSKNHPHGDMSQLVVIADRPAIAHWLLRTNDTSRRQMLTLLSGISRAWMEGYGQNLPETSVETAPDATL